MCVARCGGGGRAMRAAQGGAALAAAGRAAARDDALRLQPARPSDAARYTCGVTAPGGATAAGDIDIQVRNPPKISPFMFSSELTEGSAVQVLCGVSSGDKPMYFSWLKDGHPIPTDLQIEEKSLNEFSLLMFSDLTARHSGDYTCSVSNHASTANYTATLSVKVAPSWITEPLDVAVLLGAPFILECAAKGYPTPVMTWFRRLGSDLEAMDHWEATGAGWGENAGFSYVSGGAEHQVAGSVARARLAARAAVRSQQGAYRCTADNGVGALLLKHVNVTVHEPAHFAGAHGSLRNVSAVRGAATALVCDARGDAPLAVRWTHRARALDLDSFRWTISETRSGEGLRSVLNIRAVEREDAGEYRCQAHNRFGKSELIIFLYVEEPPEAPRSVLLGGTSSRWIRVRWRARPEATVQYSALCTSLNTLPTPDDTTLAINLTLETGDDDTPDSQGYRSLSSKLEGLRPAAAYSLRLIASNHVGQSPHSEPLLFTTLEEAPNGTPQNIHVKPVNTEELHVSWSAPAQHTWNGELLGYVVSWRELSRMEEDSAEWEGADEGAGLRAGSAVSVGWSSSEIALVGLREFARYALTMRAYNAAGAGPHSPVVYATTADGVPETAPSDVTCVSEGARSLRVRWAPPRAAHNVLSGYDVLYAPIHNAPICQPHSLLVHNPERIERRSERSAIGTDASVCAAWRGAGAEQALRVAGAAAREAALALRAAAVYSLRVRARAPRGPGPASPPLHCATTDDVPGAVETLRAVATSHDTVRVAWLPPAEHTAHLTHYTLHIRELARAGGEWSQRVEVQQDYKFQTFSDTLKKIGEQNYAIQQSIEFLSAKYDNVLKKMESLHKENEGCKSRITLLENKIELMERSALASTIEIRNVPKMRFENKQALCELLKHVGLALNQPIEDNDICDIYRIKSKFKEDTPIIARLNTTSIKESIIRSVKSFNKQNRDMKLSSKHLQIDGPPRPIFVCEALTAKARRLFHLAKEFAKTNNYNRCWISYGKIFLRKIDGLPSIKIDSEEDLNRLK
ncbi:unnamed protein product [Parnassius apollo]|uniref:(apollo) hypothetical protein n=1 Tax=Parnassius apollo TaxID=110799 RepID=A0A8S3WQQ2_PARAO|nr:unnamed protein product [Parnassius apollo]